MKTATSAHSSVTVAILLERAFNTQYTGEIVPHEHG